MSGYEFKQRPDGSTGLLEDLRAAHSTATRSRWISGLLYAALKSRKVDLIAANSTDGLASAMDVAILEDDRHYFPPYECAVVVRERDALALSGLRAALEELSGKLPDAVMRKLNYAVDGEHRSVAQVAAEFLRSL